MACSEMLLRGSNHQRFLSNMATNFLECSFSSCGRKDMSKNICVVCINRKTEDQGSFSSCEEEAK